jgi:hypothetical protein
MTDDSRGLLPVLAAALPCAAAALAVVVFAATELSGRTLFSYGPEQNMAEAAALGRLSEVVRRLDAGEDPARIVAVRPHVISSSVTRVSTLEAAVWHRSAALMRLLDRSGAIRDADTRHHLECLARDLDVDEIARLFAHDASAACVPQQTVTAIIERSRASSDAP